MEEQIMIERAEKLATVLYEDLKTKYILLKEDSVRVYETLYRVTKKLRRRCQDLYPLKYGRRQFNYGLRKSIETIEEYARKNNLDLQHTVNIVALIQAMKIPPITEENKHLILNNKSEKDDDN